MSFAARRSKKPKAVRRRFSNSDDDDEILPTQVKSTDTSAKTNTNTSMNTETTTVTSTGTDTVNKSIGMSIGGQPANAATHSSVSIGGSGSTIVGKTSEDIKDADSANSVAFKKRAKGKKKREVNKPVSIQMSDDEEDGEVEFQIKKSSASRKLAKQMRNKQDVNIGIVVPEDAVSGSPTKTGGYYSQAGVYDKKTLQTMRHQASAHPARAVQAQAQTTNAMYIPDAKTIHEARKRREKMRDGKDYVPLNEGGANASHGFDGDENRIEFGDTNKIQSRQKKFEMEGALMHHMVTQHTAAPDNTALRDTAQASDSEDDEIARWEREQMRKGAGQSKGPNGWGVSSQSMGSSETISTAHLMRQEARLDIPQLSNNTPVSVDQVIAKLAVTINSVTLKYNEDNGQLTRTKDSLDGATDRMNKLGNAYTAAKETYSYFSDIRSYMAVLIDCLDEKVPLIVNCEAKMHTIIKDISHRKITGRREDVRVSLMELDSIAPGRNFGAKLDPKVKTTQQKSASEKEKSRELEDSQRKEMVQRVSARRVARKAARQIRSGVSKEVGMAGMSSADEYSGVIDLSDLREEAVQVKHTASQTFDDVDDVYASISYIQNKLQHWKNVHPLAYRDAYVSECAPHIFAPFVRLALLQWNPLEPLTDSGTGTSKSFEEMDWFTGLLEFGPPTSEEDVDAHMVPTLITLTLIPKLLGFIGHVWDIHSSQQTQRLHACLDNLSEYPMMDATDTQGSGAKVTSDVSRAIVTRLSEFVDNEIFVPLFSASELARFGPAQRKEVQTSMERRCCAAVKIALNALQLGTYASVVALRDVVVDDILNKHLIPAWEALGPTTVVVSLVIKIANALPADWLTDLTKLEELSQLYKFRNCVNTLYIESNRRANEAIDNTELGRVRALLYDVKL